MAPSGSSRGCLWGAVGCAAALLVFAGIGAGVVFFVFGAMRSSGAYEDALRLLRAHPAAREALGEPIEAGWFVSGSIQVTGPSGEARLSIPVSGPKGKGTLYVEAVKRAGQWQMQLLQLAPSSGARIDLLAGGVPGSAGGEAANGRAAEGPADEPGAGRPLLTDAFDDPRSGWSTWTSDDSSIRYGDGRLVVANGGDWGSVLSHYKGRGFGDGLIEVDVVPLSKEAAWVGIVVRRQENNQGHALYVGGNALMATTGEALLLPFDQSTVGTLPSRLHGWRPRRLRVLARGATLRFSVDDLVVWTIDSSPWREGGVSLAVVRGPGSGPARVAFDNFRVWANETR